MWTWSGGRQLGWRWDEEGMQGAWGLLQDFGGQVDSSRVFGGSI